MKKLTRQQLFLIIAGMVFVEFIYVTLYEWYSSLYWLYVMLVFIGNGISALVVYNFYTEPTLESLKLQDEIIDLDPEYQPDQPKPTLNEIIDKERSLNLCDNCHNEIATCKSNPKFGSGLGNDNVYECEGYIPKNSP